MCQKTWESAVGEQHGRAIWESGLGEQLERVLVEIKNKVLFSIILECAFQTVCQSVRVTWESSQGEQTGNGALGVEMFCYNEEK